jgi:hypothetical protein
MGSCMNADVLAPQQALCIVYVFGSLHLLHNKFNLFYLYCYRRRDAYGKHWKTPLILDEWGIYPPFA